MIRARSGIAAALLALLFAVGLRAAEPDGPYVVRIDGRLESWAVVVADGVAQKHVQPIKDLSVVSVPAVGKFPEFAVKLRPDAAPAVDSLTVPAKSPLFVVADTHGEFEILAEMLRKHGVLDERLHWKFGRGHLVVLGDVFDRGPNHTEILWLLYELEAQARKAGGGAHLVLGNHETMIMRGDLRYLNPKYLDTAKVFGVAYYKLFDGQSVLGQWLRSRPVALKINDALYLHGGISRALLDQGFKLPEINSTARAALHGQEGEREEFLLSNLGPLWYRGYFAESGDMLGASMADVDLALETFGVRRILVGHTTVPTITPLYDGKVIAVQVYPKRDAAGQVSFECLLIRGDKLLRAKFDGGTESLTGPQ